MMSKTNSLLEALEGRGPAAYTGEPLAYLLIEVRGGCLQISGAMPLEAEEDCYTRSGAEYRYVLEREAAEALLEALIRQSPQHPERTIAESFEFARPDCPLKDYLDRLHVTYKYEYWKGEPFYGN